MTKRVDLKSEEAWLAAHAMRQAAEYWKKLVSDADYAKTHEATWVNLKLTMLRQAEQVIELAERFEGADIVTLLEDE